MDAIVDIINNGQANGNVASQIQNNGRLNLNAMRPYIAEDGKTYMTVYNGGPVADAKSWGVKEIQTNATLRRDEWKQLDDAVMEVSRQRLGGIDDLISKGLTYNLGNAMGTTVLEWHDISDALEATITMDGITRGNNDAVVYKHNYLPIPIIHADYEINARFLAVSRNMGNPLDTTMAERAARRVAEKLEDMLFTNTTYSFGEKDSRSRNSIYSYINFPDRNPVTLTAAWDESGKTPAQILADVMAMKQASLDAYHWGPWMLYIPTAYEQVMDEDYDVSGSSLMTIRERIMKLQGIQAIKVIDKLPANNVLLVQMTSDTVRLVRGMGLQNVEWDTEGKFITKHKVLTIQVPQLRSDQNGRCGLVHLA